MTQCPEVHLVKELNMCPLNISLITDYDAGLVNDCEPVSHEAVMKVFADNISKLQKLLFSIIENIDTTCDCVCNHTVE
jgi:5'-methylthioadenosine phosphorylase